MLTKSIGFLVLSLMFLVGCSDNSNRLDCTSQAQCNPDKTCGNMSQCVDGKCDSEITINLPCEQDCSLDNNCPVGMYCRLTDGVGECVADGTCVDPQECSGLEHDDCVGSFSCEAGICKYNCQQPNSCANDDECILADKNCCCGRNEEDFIALPQEQLDEWIAREECKGVICPKIVCIQPTTIEAACLEGKCQIRKI